MFNCINTHTLTYILRPFNHCFPIPIELEKKDLHTKNPTFKVLISVCVYQSESDCLFILSKNGELFPDLYFLQYTRVNWNTNDFKFYFSTYWKMCVA